MSKGEFTSVASANGGMEAMINWDGKDKDTLALIKHIVDEDKLAKIELKLNMFTAGRARARLSAVPTGPVLEINSGTGLSLCLKARARVHAVNIEKMLWILWFRCVYWTLNLRKLV